jgi:hypothetical protein
MSDARLGVCSKTQYEHCGPHEQILEVGQGMPPFPCINWKPTPTAIPAEEERDAALKEAGLACWCNSDSAPVIRNQGCPFHSHEELASLRQQLKDSEQSGFNRGIGAAAELIDEKAEFGDEIRSDEIRALKEQSVPTLKEQ